MATINSIKVEAIVIAEVDYKESSKILKLFSKELGIISVMARGAKRATSKMQNLTSIYTVAEFELTKRNDFYYLEDGKILTAFLHLRTDIRNIYSAQLCIEFIDRTLMESQVHFDLYELLIKTIKFLEFTEHRNRLLSMFLIKYISMIGYRPVLNRCVYCGKIPLEKGFSIELGGIVCLDHGVSNIYLDGNDYKYYLWLFYSKIDDVNDLDIQVDESEICRNLIRFVIEKTEIKKPIVLDAYSKFMLN